MSYGTSGSSTDARTEKSTGLYRHYLFGVMDAPGVEAPKFEWDYANNRLASDPKSVRLNWMAISSKEGAADSFNFWAFT